LEVKHAQLELKDVSAHYGSMQVLYGLTLDIRASECVALLGANGAGKTTLLRTLSGIFVRRGGTILFNGSDISKLAPHLVVRAGIGQVAENRRLFPPLTVAENLEMGSLTLHSLQRKREVAGASTLVFELFPVLWARRSQPAGTLSGGEQQMLAIGRALMGKPSVLLLDEPSTGLAPRVVEELFRALERLKAAGMTIVLAEQNVRLALGLADRAAVLSLGRIALVGSPTQLQENDEVKRIYLGG
jgi:branched-chain amino acid transport system ATP-binding protein